MYPSPAAVAARHPVSVSVCNVYNDKIMCIVDVFYYYDYYFYISL